MAKIRKPQSNTHTHTQRVCKSKRSIGHEFLVKVEEQMKSMHQERPKKPGTEESKVK